MVREPRHSRGLLIDRLFLAIGAGLLVGSVAVGVFWTLPTAREAVSARSWPVTSGTVVHSELERQTSHSDGRTQTTHTPVVRYLYDVPRAGGTVRLLGDRVSIAPVRTESASRSIVDRHPVGRTIEVHYDPTAPWRAVIEADSSSWGAWFVPAIMFTLGVMFTVLPSVALRRSAEEGAVLRGLGDDQRRTLGGCLTIVGGIFVVVATGVGVLLVRVAGGEAARVASTADWVPTAAIVEASGFEVVGDRVDAPPRPVVRYRWSHGGVERRGSTLNLAEIPPAKAADWSEPIFLAVPGENALIHVDPDDPDRSVLVAGDPVEAWGFVGLGMLVPAFLAVFGVVLLVQARRIRRPSH